MASDQSVVTVKNIGRARVVICGKWLMPDETRMVRRVEYDTAKRLYPNALTLVLDEREARGEKRETPTDDIETGDVGMRVVNSFAETREDGSIEKVDVVEPVRAGEAMNEDMETQTVKTKRAGRGKRA